MIRSNLPNWGYCPVTGVISGATNIGDDTLNVSNSAEFTIGDQLVIDRGTSSEETTTIIDKGSLVIHPALTKSHADNATVESRPALTTHTNSECYFRFGSNTNSFSECDPESITNSFSECNPESIGNSFSECNPESITNSFSECNPESITNSFSECNPESITNSFSECYFRSVTPSPSPTPSPSVTLDSGPITNSFSECNPESNTNTVCNSYSGFRRTF